MLMVSLIMYSKEAKDIQGALIFSFLSNRTSVDNYGDTDVTTESRENDCSRCLKVNETNAEEEHILRHSPFFEGGDDPKDATAAGKNYRQEDHLAEDVILNM